MSILAQVADTKTNTTVYTVPTGKSALITKIWLFDNENVARRYAVRLLASADMPPGQEWQTFMRGSLVNEPSDNGFWEFQSPLTLSEGTKLTVDPGVVGSVPDSVTVFGEEAADTTTYATPLMPVLVGTTLTDVYTVPAGKKLAISTLVIAEATDAVRRVWLSFAKGGAADASSQYVLFNYRLEPLDVYIFTGGITLDAGDVVRCKSDVANGVAISIHGILQ